MELTTLTDEDLDQLRVEVLTEQERRRLIADAPAQAVALADRYAAAIGRQDGDPWVQPTGAHDAYNKGDKVSFNGQDYESLIDGNSWSPSDYPAGWKVIA